MVVPCVLFAPDVSGTGTISIEAWAGVLKTPNPFARTTAAKAHQAKFTNRPLACA
jgi:hypothetical protein